MLSDLFVFAADFVFISLPFIVDFCSFHTVLFHCPFSSIQQGVEGCLHTGVAVFPFATVDTTLSCTKKKKQYFHTWPMTCSSLSSLYTCWVTSSSVLVFCSAVTYLLADWLVYACGIVSRVLLPPSLSDFISYLFYINFSVFFSVVVLYLFSF